MAFNYAYGYRGAYYSIVQLGVSCYNPIIVLNHIFHTVNDYYQKNLEPINCIFGGTAQLTSNDLSTNLQQTNSNHNSHLVVDEVPNLAYLLIIDNSSSRFLPKLTNFVLLN